MRLGLAGLRRAEIARPTVRDVSRLPLITWTGKDHKPRKTTAGPSLASCSGRYLDAYDNPAPGKPLLCRRPQGNAAHTAERLLWGAPISVGSVYTTVRNRAALAGHG